MELIPDLPPEALIESPPALPAEKSAGPRLGSALLVSVIFYAVTFGVTIPIVIVLMVMKKPLDQIMLVLAGQLVAWPAAMLAGSLICKRPWRESYAVRGFSLRLLPGVVIGCFGLSFVLNRLASAIPMPKSFESFFKGLADGDPVLTLVVISVIAPIAEELFFRGWMLRGFMANYSAKKAIWLSALMFALFHLNPWQAVVALPLGLLFGWLVLRTGSLAPGIIGHFVVNFTNTKLMLPACALFGHNAEAIKEATHLPWDVVSAGAMLSVVGIGWLWRELRLSKPTLS
jgi:membrane protease YdiL (CAAX protease family)